MDHERTCTPRRADLALVERGFFESRAKAKEAIAAGLVRADSKVLRKPSELIDTSARIEASAPYPWVSRGGVKLAAALDAFGFDPSGHACLDIGAATGGFTEVLLARGAAGVTSVDVGHGQLHPSVAKNPRVTSLEGLDARRLTREMLGGAPTFIACDLSFISLTLVLPKVLPLAASQARLVALIKPQFEVGPAHVRKGIVRDPAIREKACETIGTLLDGLGWHRIGLIASPIEGGDGNQEYLVGATAPHAELA